MAVRWLQIERERVQTGCKLRILEILTIASDLTTLRRDGEFV